MIMKKFMLFGFIAALALLLVMPAGSVFAANWGQGTTYAPRASQLIGAPVKNEQGHVLGKVSDLLVGANGNIDYLVVSHVPGAGEKLIPVPFDAAYVHTRPNGVILRGIDQAKLDNAPSISANDWQKLDSRSFDHQVRGYYGQTGVYPEGYLGRNPRPVEPTPETQIGTHGYIERTARNPWNLPPEGYVGPSPGSSGNTQPSAITPQNY